MFLLKTFSVYYQSVFDRFIFYYYINHNILQEYEIRHWLYVFLQCLLRRELGIYSTHELGLNEESIFGLNKEKRVALCS